VFVACAFVAWLAETSVATHVVDATGVAGVCSLATMISACRIRLP
jgi:hypothetical protein